MRSILHELYLRISQISLFQTLLPIEEIWAVKLCLEETNCALDSFVQLENCQAGVIEYSTVHGYRLWSQKHPEYNQFVVLKKGDGFAQAVTLPYGYTPINRFHQHSKLVVNSHLKEAASQAGYASAVELPYFIQAACHAPICLSATMVVCVRNGNSEAMAMGYANALPIAVSKSDIYVENKQMLDTD